MPRTVLALCLLAFAGCGSSDGEKRTTAVTGPAPPARQERPAEPRGRLTEAEFKALSPALVAIERGDDASSPARALPFYAKGCRKLARPATTLVTSTRDLCDRAVAVVRSVRDLERELPRCTAANEQGDTACSTGALTGLGRAAHVYAAAARRLNSAVRRRGLKGGCARALATPRSDLRSLVELERAMRSAAQALDARDPSKVGSARGRIHQVGHFVETDSARLLRRCKRA